MQCCRSKCYYAIKIRWQFFHTHAVSTAIRARDLSSASSFEEAPPGSGATSPTSLCGASLVAAKSDSPEEPLVRLLQNLGWKVRSTGGRQAEAKSLLQKRIAIPSTAQSTHSNQTGLNSSTMTIILENTLHRRRSEIHSTEIENCLSNIVTWHR